MGTTVTGRGNALFVIDRGQRIVEVGDRGTSLPAGARGEVLGLPCFEVVAGCDAEGSPVCKRMCTGFKALTRGSSFWSTRFIVRRRNVPSLFLTCELMALPRVTGGAVVRMGECSQADPLLVEQEPKTAPTSSSPDVLRDLCALARASTLLSENSLRDCLDPTLDIVRQVSGAEAVELFLIDREQKHSVLTKYRGPLRNCFLQMTHFREGEGFPGLVWLNQRPIVTRDLEHDSRYLRSKVKARGFRSYLAYPLVGLNGPLGSLNLASRSAEVDLGRAYRLISWLRGPLTVALERGQMADDETALYALPAIRRVFFQAELNNHYIDIRCLGAFELRRQGELIVPSKVPLRKALTLLKILLTYEGQYVPRDTLIELLWPEVDIEAGTGRLHVTVHALRKLLDDGDQQGQWHLVKSDSGGYCFDIKAPCRIDTVEFKDLAQHGMKAERSGDVDGAIKLYQSAVDIYRGDFLEEEPFSEWCAEKREDIKRTCLSILKRLSVLCSQTGDPGRSIEHLRRAVRIDPLQEELHRELMRRLWQAHRRDEALGQYQFCCQILRKDLDVEPLPETTQLAQLIAGTVPP